MISKKIIIILAVAFTMTACTNQNKNEPINHENPIQEEKDENQEVNKKPEKQEGIRPEFKEAMDSYEDFFDEYVTFMNKYSKSEDTISMMSDYLNYMTKYSETMSQIEKLDESEMSDEEVVYYTKVMSRINQKIMDIED